MDINKPHDTFFKELMNDPDNLRDFLRNFTPEALATRIDYDSIQVVDTEKTNKKYKKFYLDFVVDCQIGKAVTDIYFVLEHKSYPDNLVLLQILNYCSVLWEENIRNNAPLKPVVPVIFYHGRARLNLPEMFVDYFEVDEFLKGYLVDFGYVFVDTSSYSDEEIAEKDYNNLYFAASLLTLKHIFSELDRLKPALSYAGRLDKDRFLFILEYIASSRDMEKEDLAELLKEVGGDTVMPTLAEKWLEEGKQQGMQQGILLGEREMVLGALAAKFGSVPDDLRKRIETIEDSNGLKRLHNQVFSCNSLDEFTRWGRNHTQISG